MTAAWQRIRVAPADVVESVVSPIPWRRKDNRLLNIAGF
jgi:hypothetical protein